MLSAYSKMIRLYEISLPANVLKATCLREPGFFPLCTNCMGHPFLLFQRILPANSTAPRRIQITCNRQQAKASGRAILRSRTSQISNTGNSPYNLPSQPLVYTSKLDLKHLLIVLQFASFTEKHHMGHDTPPFTAWTHLSPVGRLGHRVWPTVLV